ncbi:MAG: bifunctional demethylmenaquinone methyltransferase/2-methoxy-6-polyprenyl-1,4-benzoquinol methylase UbiE [Bosea sp. (in: a-proteobacteria)]
MMQANTKSDGDTTTHFGFEDVKLSQKQGLVDDVFHKVAGRYDLMNDLMSAGLHRLWKEAMVAELPLPRSAASRPFTHLDVAGGTGDVAFRVLDKGEERSPGKTAVTVFDINGEMLKVGRERADKRYPEGEALTFTQGNAEELPFEDRSFDGYTVAFGIRNVPRIQKALNEAYRVLRPGGRLLVLEFSPVETPLLDRIYDAYSFNVIPPMGGMVTGDPEPYRYLVESIRKFPNAARFAQMIRGAGFARVNATPMSGGIVQLHAGWRL